MTLCEAQLIAALKGCIQVLKTVDSDAEVRRQIARGEKAIADCKSFSDRNR